tara:strand:- start:558 stop:1520 length:963 start_codon:yes stop_codon:yes gene_type:complete
MRKKHVHWLLPGNFRDIESVKNHILASVRLRAYISTLNSKMFTFSFGENMPINTDVLVIGKIGIFNLEKRGLNWINQIKITNFSRGKVILDYTDNHLMMNSPLTNFYKATLPYITTAVTPSEKMGDFLSNFWKGQVTTIYDSIEVDIIPWRDRIGQKLLWFGHSSNIQYLLDFINKNESIIDNYSLNIICNQDGIDYFNKHNKTNLNYKTLFWSKDILVKEANYCDVCIIPSNIESINKQGAGHNRLITALALGMPTIATLLPSYKMFKNYFVDIESEERLKILDDPNIFKQKLIESQKKVVPLFQNTVLNKKWQKILSI